MSSSIGDAGSFLDPRSVRAAGTGFNRVAVPAYRAKYKSQTDALRERYRQLDVPYRLDDSDTYDYGTAFTRPGTLAASGVSPQASAAPTTAKETLLYFYHPDHLGSSGFITNLD